MPSTGAGNMRISLDRPLLCLARCVSRRFRRKTRLDPRLRVCNRPFHWVRQLLQLGGLAELRNVFGGTEEHRSVVPRS